MFCKSSVSAFNLLENIYVNIYVIYMYIDMYSIPKCKIIKSDKNIVFLFFYVVTPSLYRSQFEHIILLLNVM